MIRQRQIADEVGLDVSSVNKILNDRPGPVFHKDTIKAVRKAARRAGWRKLCCACRKPVDPKASFRFDTGKELCRSCVLSVVRRYVDVGDLQESKFTHARKTVIGSGGVSPITVDLGDPRFPNFGGVK